ncbi:hypothetical protein PLUTO_00540 [Luteibacter phage vB_LflM-Pluto]|uniref:Acb2/Tad1 hairpin domain-containing protein n=1 Tax=Luteibacter phage vB_LflM-Pluto TaxID=2948611 RepID=A0A9E7MUN3_9CAUD|nr:hypothetical protein PLUTO_00540 [Luteibacter phage vB_LflM-Pluto]
MENQHRKITGYRELSQEDIDLINDVKAKGAEFIALITKADSIGAMRYNEMVATELASGEQNAELTAELERIKAAEPWAWFKRAKFNAQTAVMFAVRAIAQPEGEV